MLKPNRVSIASAAAALIVVPTLLAAPAIAQTKVYVVGDRNKTLKTQNNCQYRATRL